MREAAKNLRTTIIAALLGTVLVLTASFTNIDLVKLNLRFLDGIEKHEVDDVFSGLALILVGLTIDRVVSDRRKRIQAEVEAQKLRTLQATMRTVQDIVNNFLNNLCLLELEMHSSVPAEVLDRLDEFAADTHSRLKALGDLDVVSEKPLALGAGIDYPEPVCLASPANYTHLQASRPPVRRTG